MAVEELLPLLVAPTAPHATTTMRRTKTTELARTRRLPTWIVMATALWLWIVQANVAVQLSRMSVVFVEVLAFLLAIAIVTATNSTR